MIKKFIRDARALWLGQLIVRLRGIILIPILTRYLGADGFGALSQVTVVAGLSAVIIVLSTDAGLLREAAGLAPEAQRRYFTAWSLFLLANCLVVGLLLVVFREALLRYIFAGDARYRSLVMVTILACLPATYYIAVRNWLMLRNRFSVLASVGIAQFVVALLAALLAIGLHQSVTAIVVYTAAGDVIVLALYWVVIGQMDGLEVPDFSIVRPVLRYGLPLLPGGFAMLGLNWMDRLFLVRYTDLRELGIYAVAYSLGFAVVPVLSDPFRTMFPVLSAQHFNQDRHDDLQRIFNYAAGTGIGLTVPALVALFVLGDIVMSMFAPPAYVDGGGLIWIIALGYVFNSFASYYENQLGLQYRQHWSTIAIGCALIVNVGLNLLLIPRHGIYGAGVATAASFAVQFLVVCVRSSLAPVVRTNVWFVLRIIFCSVGMGVCVSLLKRATAPAGFNPIALMALLVPVGVVSYSALLLVTGTVSRELIGAGLSTVLSLRAS